MKSENGDLQKILEKLTHFFQSREEVMFAYLFGSAARNRLTLLSDIDIAVAMDPAKITEANLPYGYHAELTSHLMNILQTNDIDLVLFNDASPVLKHRIFSEGIKLFCRDSGYEKQAFLCAFQEYQDTTLLRQTQFFYLNRYLKKLGKPRAYGRS